MGDQINETTGPPEWLKTEDELDDNDLDRIQIQEIARINAHGVDEALGQFAHRTQQEAEIAFKELSRKVHPDKQPAARRQEADEAMKKLNEARERFHIPNFEVAPAIKPDKKHKQLWNQDIFKGAIRGLQIDSENQAYINVLNLHNKTIEDKVNRPNAFGLERGKFPVPYMQHQYRSAQKLRQNHFERTNDTEKKLIAGLYASLHSGLVSFCEDRYYPSSWALQSGDVNDEIETIPQIRKAERFVSTQTNGQAQSRYQQSHWQPQQNDGQPQQTGSVPQQTNGQAQQNGQAQPNGQPQQSAGQPQQTGPVPQQTNGQAQQNGQAQPNGQPQQNGSHRGNQHQLGPEQRIFGQQLGPEQQQQGLGQQQGPQQYNEQRDDMMNLDNAMAALTVRNEPVVARRKVFDTEQYLVAKHDGQHEWQTGDMCSPNNTAGLEFLGPKEASWLKERRHKYKGLRWVALAFDGAIILGVGVYPPVSMMVEWLDDRPDTLMWRGDVLRVTSAERVDRDVQEKLPYNRFTTFEGRKIYIMAATESGLIAGQQKAINRIMKLDNKISKSVTAPQAVGQLLAPPSFPQLPAPPIFGQPSTLGWPHGPMQLGPQVSGQYGSPASGQYGVQGQPGSLIPYGAQGPSQVGSQFPGQQDAQVSSIAPLYSAPSTTTQPIELASIVASMQNLMQQQSIFMQAILPQLQQQNSVISQQPSFVANQPQQQPWNPQQQQPSFASTQQQQQQQQQPMIPANQQAMHAATPQPQQQQLQFPANQQAVSAANPQQQQPSFATSQQQQRPMIPANQQAMHAATPHSQQQQQQQQQPMIPGNQQAIVPANLQQQQMIPINQQAPSAADQQHLQPSMTEASEEEL